MCERIGDCLLYHGDCFDVLPQIPPDSVDLVLADPPYGITQCKWDSVLDLDRLWPELWRITKPRAAVVMTAAQPFSSVLVQSGIRWYRHEWIWCKNNGSNFGTVKFGPMKEHEEVLVFACKTPLYLPIKQSRQGSGIERIGKVDIETGQKIKQCYEGGQLHGRHVRHSRPRLRHPSTVQKFNVERGLHPTQKPVALMEYMIKTYTNTQQAVVLDFCMSSGTTGVACINTDRTFIGIERDPEHYATAHRRLTEHLAKPPSARIKPPPKRRRRRKGPPRDQLVLFSTG